MTTPYPKRLIEVDLPIKKISAHARREKSIRHGHISTLHIWWARRPLAACRAVVCAALWPDPADENCPVAFRERAVEIVTAFAGKCVSDKDLAETCSKDTWARWHALTKPEAALDAANSDHLNSLRYLLLDFIADFANWDNSTVPAYLDTSRALTQAAHEALGGEPGTRPLVVDPFAGGGAIPLEALRVGADAFASDLNPVAVLLNKVVLEYIPKYGQRLADEVRKWGKWIKEEAEKELAEFYPQDPDGATPIAYLWARTILSEAPGEGDVPVEVPLMRTLWLAKKKGRNRALRWVRDAKGGVKTETLQVTYADGITRKVRRPLLEIFEPKKESEVEDGTVARGSATCPVTGYTTPVARVREQLRTRCGGASDARMLSVVSTHAAEQGRFYRVPTEADVEATRRATAELCQRETADNGDLSLVPDEELDLRGIRHTWSMIYGMTCWGHLFSSRQALALVTLVRLTRDIGDRLRAETDDDFAQAAQTTLALAMSRQSDYTSSLCSWHLTRELIGHTFARQALPMVWDFAEVCPFARGSGDFGGALSWITRVCESNASLGTQGTVESADAADHPLPDDSAHSLVTDPPYYDSIAYAYLSDYFYVWLRRAIGANGRGLLRAAAVPKDTEIVVDRPHELSSSSKDIAFYEAALTRAFCEGRRVLRPDGVGAVVFASKTTASWEALLQALLDAGWVVTASWPIDTEMAAKVAGIGQARLMSSVHIACRPRENPDGSLRTDDVGDWRDVLTELPERIHAWMPRLAREGVVGADAIFACLGPALEIFSRYASVEKASGEQVTLREYLEEVWAAVSREALGMIFEGADASGFEEDARLTAMWLWTLHANANGDNGESDGKPQSLRGYSLEYDAARKIAQGLGAHLENLSHLVEIKGDTVTLLSAGARARHLFGKDAGDVQRSRRKKPKAQMQLNLEEELRELGEELGDWAEEVGGSPGATVLDQLHQSMILFGAGRSQAMNRLLVEDGVGRNPLFWRLAQALSALYPAGTEEKRWVDGVLARKKGLGF